VLEVGQDAGEPVILGEEPWRLVHLGEERRHRQGELEACQGLPGAGVDQIEVCPGPAGTSFERMLDLLGDARARQESNCPQPPVGTGGGIDGQACHVGEVSNGTKPAA